MVDYSTDADELIRSSGLIREDYIGNAQVCDLGRVCVECGCDIIPSYPYYLDMCYSCQSYYIRQQEEIAINYYKTEQWKQNE